MQTKMFMGNICKKNNFLALCTIERHTKSSHYEGGVERDSEQIRERVGEEKTKGQHVERNRANILPSILLMYVLTVFPSFNPSLSSPLTITRSTLHRTP